ncbi:PREDICTED: transcription factor IIIB 50 kDa subunit-like [Branchiostoma belcheri]|uniref:Transcription factor IIIB 50 kDa subunit n=1 Tax=Branchiostoma belcheri TaxID=7741 RepID=A0A6P4YTS0_BRABE|nr:PREDICTED: transcription factor IIIB 50 kDa subunit-like [Branchiostoma belcheri]
MSAKVCTQCGGQNIQQDLHFCLEQQICIDCGCVVEEGSFQNDASRIYAPHQSITLPQQYRQRNNFHGYVSKARKAGAKKVEEISAMLRVTSQAMVDEAKALYLRAYDLPTLNRTRREKKNVLPGCCVYIVCRQHDWPITVSVLWDLIQCRDSVFYSVYKVILTDLNIIITAPDIEEVIPSVIKKCDFNFQLDDEQMKTITRIVCLAKNTWISCGRRYDPIIIAVVFLVWKASDYAKRKKTSIPSFYRQKKSGPQVVALVRSRVNELEDILIKLASEIPWVQPGEVNKQNVVCYISDILQYEKTLLDGKDIFSDDSDVESEEEEREQKDKFLPPGMKNRKPTSDVRDDNETSSDISVQVSYSTELGENDIPDSEMHKYIRTSQEVKMVEEVMKRDENKIETENPGKRKDSSSSCNPHKRKRSDVENLDKTESD